MDDYGDGSIPISQTQEEDWNVRSPPPPCNNDDTTSRKKARLSTDDSVDIHNGFDVYYLSSDDNGFRTNDEIHITIAFCPVMWAIVNTAQMQRLRNLKQLGVGEYAYVNCNHSRFEHSLGVCHLAVQFVSKLAEKQPKLNITAKDKLCVGLAGLLHDIGHGAFSHVYDGLFPKQVAKHLEEHPHLKCHYQDMPHPPEGWRHEDGSCMMIDALLEALGLAIDTDNLDEPLKQIGDGVANTAMRVYSPLYDESIPPEAILTSRDWIFIKEQILASPLDGASSSFVGRPHVEQEFLYDIVSNRHSGMDVDKMDYLPRDKHRALKGSGVVNYILIEEAVVAKAPCPKPNKCFKCKHLSGKKEHYMICYPDKCRQQVIEFFQDRLNLHYKVYSHKATQAATFMIADIMTKADPYFRLASDQPGGQRLAISRAMCDPHVYLRLTDSIIELIENDVTNPQLFEAQELLRRFRRREMYKRCGYRTICHVFQNDEERRRELQDEAACASENMTKEDIRKLVDAKCWDLTEEEIHEMLWEQIKGQHSPNEEGLTPNDIIVEKREIHMGAASKNPLLNIRFLRKEDLKRLATKSMDNLPRAYQPDEADFRAHLTKDYDEKSIRVFCRSVKKKSLLNHVFLQWETHIVEQFSPQGGLNTFDEVVVVEDSKPAAIESEPGEHQPQPLSQDISPIPTNNFQRYRDRNSLPQPGSTRKQLSYPK